MHTSSDFLPIEDYFIIGDLRTAALVSKQGSIDWLCLPYFDSPSIFSKLLDPSAGCLAIDMPGYKITAQYIEDTAIVEFKLSDGKNQTSIKDFMVPQATKKEVSQQLVRTISGVRGNGDVTFKFQPKPNYADGVAAVNGGASSLHFSTDSGTVALYLPKGTRVDKDNTGYQISVPLKAKESKQLILEYIPQGKESKLPTRLEAKTTKFWQQWVKQGTFFDFCRSYLVRSAITLKLMQFYPTGALVAAPTASLPEEIGGIRNWDYRYTWIRDATFALYSFYVLGYKEEAELFFNFIEKVTQQCAEQSFDMSLMYTVWGKPVPTERSLNYLSGYKNSQPVRVGNAAAQQFQLDVYGSLIDAFYFASKYGLGESHHKKWRRLIMQLVSKIDEFWQNPDYGIWEARVGTKHYTYSKVMAWVGANRAARLENILRLSKEELEVCNRLERTIEEWIWQNCYQDDNLTQHPKTKSVDATNFLFVLLQFLDKHKPLTRQIIHRTTKSLVYQKVFVYRYLKPDGLPGKEGAFVICSFWLISALAILEDVELALDLFKQLEKCIKSHGLLSEEIETKSKEYLGNYPQAFSHMGYIMAAHYLNKYAKRKNIKL